MLKPITLIMAYEEFFMQQPEQASACSVDRTMRGLTVQILSTLSVNSSSTRCLEKTTHLPVDHNFGKYRPIFKILSLADSQGNSLLFTLSCCYITLQNSKKIMAERLLLPSKLIRFT